MHELLPPLYALPLFGIIAYLYASVGHGGASGYLALFAVLGVADPAIVPAALMLNILVAGMGTAQYYSAGYFRGDMLLPFVVASIPAAFAGGMIDVPRPLFSALLGAALLFSAWRLLFLRVSGEHIRELHGRALWLRALPLGAALGFLAGMTGIGGGVFLSPLLLLLRWADIRHTAALSAAFIVLNSLSGLSGHLMRVSVDPLDVLPLMAVVGLGGYFGSRAGAVTFKPRTVRFILAVVLMLAGGKLIGGMLALLV